MAAAEDVETQQKGMCAIFYQSNPLSRIFATSSDRANSREYMSVYPIRVTAFHVCLPNNPGFSFIKAVAMACATPEVRARMRFHLGGCRPVCIQKNDAN
jgi:hypothetical protein